MDRILRRAHNRLSYRECEVLKGIAEGLSSKEIANHLCITAKTADNHASSICSKLEATNRVHAAIQGIAANIILIKNGRIVIGKGRL